MKKGTQNVLLNNYSSVKSPAALASLSWVICTDAYESKVSLCMTYKTLGTVEAERSTPELADVRAHALNELESKPKSTPSW